MTSLTQKSLNNFTYWEALYGSVTDDTPMIVTLHWMGGKPDAMQVLYDGVDYPLRAVFLQAPYPLEGGYTWYPDGDDFYKRDEAGQAPDIRHEADAVASFLWELKQKYPAKLAVTGMSQG